MGAISQVSQILPVLSGFTRTVGTITQALGAVQNVAGQGGRRDQNLALNQLRERQNLEQAQSVANAQLERDRLALDARQNEEERRAALKRAVARQRANFGSQGVGSQGGSSQAVLLGLFDETEEELARRQQMDNLRSRSLDQGLSQQSALNLLQATQLAERQRINRLF